MATLQRSLPDIYYDKDYDNNGIHRVPMWRIVLFNKHDNSKSKVIITNDGVDFSTSAVRHIRLKDFLKMESLEEG